MLGAGDLVVVLYVRILLIILGQVRQVTAAANRSFPGGLLPRVERLNINTVANVILHLHRVGNGAAIIVDFAVLDSWELWRSRRNNLAVHDLLVIVLKCGGGTVLRILIMVAVEHVGTRQIGCELADNSVNFLLRH